MGAMTNKRGPKPTYDLLQWLIDHPAGLKMSYAEIAKASGIPGVAVRRQINLLFVANKLRRTSYLEFVVPPVRHGAHGTDEGHGITDR